ncbi:MAG: phospho-sugar mutase [Simkaniaceae bacterium]|nr:phospho-sugar mutase [Simkaniaceae bacterium]
MELPEEVQKHIDEWLSGPFDDETKKQLQDKLASSPHDLIDAFSKNLTFGTGGMREKMGIGPNRMNIYTVRKATQGLCNHLIKEFPEKKACGVVIGYDCRHRSKEFALESARVLAGNGITAHLSFDLRPTPFVSFACRSKKAIGAIMITASHNPKEYNGYKVYGFDGAQVVAPHDKQIVEEVSNIHSQKEVKLADSDDPLITYLTEETDQAYLNALTKLSLMRGHSNDLKIVYTPLNGCGITMTPQALERWGFHDLETVEEQSTPDGDFPTLPSPNPEDPTALEIGIHQMKEHERDILLASDPDADRIGVAFLHKSRTIQLNGNEIAVLCLDYILSSLQEQNIMPKRSAAITTIVSTPMFRVICESYGVSCYEVLTGFKYIGELIRQWESSEEGYSFLFGAEESHGYLFGTHSRDKDAMIANCLISEIAQRAKKEGRTLLSYLYDLYRTHGIFREKQQSLKFDSGAQEEMNAFVQKLRASPPSAVHNIPVVRVEDYLNDASRPEGLPSSNVITLHLEDGSRLVIRPSGTEPKVKIYAAVRAPCENNLEEMIKQLDTKLDNLINDLSNQK